jgi:hypothetical protein
VTPWQIVVALLGVTHGAMRPAELWHLREDVAFAMLDAAAANNAIAARPAAGDVPAANAGQRGRVQSMDQLRSFLKSNRKISDLKG